MKLPHSMTAGGFTLIEILLASAAAALILAAIYGIFQHAISLRDSDTRRIHDMRVRARAATVIRNDLRNAFISGGLFASIVQGDSAGTDGANSAYPGYLKFTTTTGKDTPADLYGDVQQVEYYVVKDTGTGGAVGGGGDLVRAITRDLLDTDQPVAEEQQILTGVQSFQVSFYDGANWQSSWSFNTADNSTTGSTASTSSTNSSGNTETLPAAIRVDIQQVAPTAGASAPAPLEILVPWTMQPFTSPTPGAERLAIMNGQLHFNGRASGSVLIVVLIVCLGLVSMTLVLGHSMLLAYRGSDNEVAGRQADLAIEGAAQYAEAIMSNVDQPGDMPDPANYQAQAVPLGESTFWFIGEPDPTDNSNTPAFGLVDEASKLNLNTASLAMLENLPGMTQDLAEAIVAWRASSSSSSSPAAATSSSAVKNAPFESVEELSQVNGGTDLLTLYGSDTNLNHVLDPDESAGGATASSPGLMEYVTVFSRQPNTLGNGTKRVNVTQTSGALTRLLNSALGSARGAQIANTIRRAGPIRSVLEFYNKSGMSATEFAEVSGTLTMSNGAYSTGLINVNTASEAVLECVPGITASTAEQIIATRAGQTEPVTNLSWVAPILGRAVSAQAGPYLTAETYQVSADIAAVGRHGRGYRRTLFVIDNSTGTPQIVYRRNLAGLGWALGSQERQALAKEEATP